MDDRRFHEQAEALGLDGNEVLAALADEVEPLRPAPATVGPSPDEALAGQSRAKLRAASAAVIRAGRGLVVDHGIGYDPEAHAAGRPCWWARARMTGGRVVENVTVEGYVVALDALEALAPEVARRARKARR